MTLTTRIQLLAERILAIMKFESIKPGMRIYDVRLSPRLHRAAGGPRMSYWPVDIVSVDLENRTALCSWNNNPAQIVGENRLAKYRKSPPNP